MFIHKKFSIVYIFLIFLATLCMPSCGGSSHDTDTNAGIVMQSDITELTEANDTATFTVTLSAKPSKDVALTLSLVGADETEVMVLFNGNDWNFHGNGWNDQSVILTPDQWNTGITITLTLNHDVKTNFDRDIMITISTQSEDEQFDELRESAFVTIPDNYISVRDCLGITTSGNSIDDTNDSVNCPKFHNLYEQSKSNGVDHQFLSADVFQSKLQNGNEYPMAIALSASGFEHILRNAIDWKTLNPRVDFSGCKTHANANTYDDFLTQNNCVAIHFSTSVQETPLQATLGVPMTIETHDADDTNPGRTTLYADLLNSKILDISSQNPEISHDDVKTAIKTDLGDAWQRIAMLDIADWEIGNKDIQRTVLPPKVYADSGILEIGILTNLDSAPLQIDHNNTFSGDLALYIQPDLVRAVVGRMMTEIDPDTQQTYISDAFSAIETSSERLMITPAQYGSDLQQKFAACSNEDQKWYEIVTLAFRFWSLDGDCGYIDQFFDFRFVSEESFKTELHRFEEGESDGAMDAFRAILTVLAMPKTPAFLIQLLHYTDFSLYFDQLFVHEESSPQPRPLSTTNGSLKLVKRDLSKQGKGIRFIMEFPQESINP